MVKQFFFVDGQIKMISSPRMGEILKKKKIEEEKIVDQICFESGSKKILLG